MQPKTIQTVCYVIAFTYIIASIANGDINCGRWSGNFRALYAVFIFLISFFAVVYSESQKD